MDFAECFIKRMTTGADAINRESIANETGASCVAKCSTINLRSVAGIDVEIDQPGGRMNGFQSNTDFLDRNGVGIEPQDEVRTQQIAGVTLDGRTRKMHRKLVQHPAIKLYHARKRFLGPRNIHRQEQRRRMPLTQNLSEGFLATVPRSQETTA